MAAGAGFRIAGIPVEVQPSFALIALIGFATGSISFGAAWTAMVFVTTLVHELGHGVAFKAYGLPPRITLYWFGGFTSAAGDLPRGRRIVTLLAGPLSELLIVGLPAMYLRSQLVVTTVDAHQILDMMVFVGVGWAIFNLLPVLPLDGGQIAQALLSRSDPARGTRLARILSIVFAAGIAVVALVERFFFGAVYAAWFAGDNMTRLQEAREAPLLERLEEGHRMLEREDGEGAAAIARDVGARARARSTRELANDLLAWAEPTAATNDASARAWTYRNARATLGAPDRDAAIEAAVRAFESEPAPPPNSLLVCELERSGVVDDVARRLLSSRSDRGPAAVERMSDDLHRAGRYGAAGRIDALLFDDGRAHRGRIAFNAACSTALSGDVPAALEWLGRAVEHGFTDVGQLDRDDDLESVRSAPGFEEVRRRMTAATNR